LYCNRNKNRFCELIQYINYNKKKDNNLYTAIPKNYQKTNIHVYKKYRHLLAN
jgi:hypothetical protein